MPPAEHVADDTLLRLRAEMRTGKAASIPANFHAHGRATRNLREPLGFVPNGTVVSVKIEVPDNNRGKVLHIGWVCTEAAGLAPEDARQQLLDELFRRFLDLSMPLPD